ncbi:serine hydrolase [Parvularcula dongshanensis]|uniref:DUF4440 domain-containing protein n=1 Tax=Parvularcula dongshanensis TaxID=1173995 RepID=A0A840I5T4_9PROT|nr:serine hydrolase [Parvularcula dongshanensis]MBB4659508.1 hypothetical protein [Parvularcula dongshanensis]
MLILLAAAALLQTLSEADLRDQILTADNVLFERAFNACDLEALHDILLPDAEMIHDQSGMNRGREAFMRPVRENICNGGPKKPIRRRIYESTEIYPLYQDGQLYGAIQRGQHEFFLREEGQPLLLTNRARYSTVWLLTDNGWKLKTALSWDHLNPIENGPLDADVLTAGFDGEDEFSRLLLAHDIMAENVATVRGGALTEERAMGLAAPGRPAATDTIYNVASLAKPVSALLALRLVDTGLLGLDEPLAPYWTDPDLEGSPFAKEVTARHVLSHTSGLPNWRYLDEGGGGGDCGS